MFAGNELLERSIIKHDCGLLVVRILFSNDHIEMLSSPELADKTGVTPPPLLASNNASALISFPPSLIFVTCFVGKGLTP